MKSSILDEQLKEEKKVAIDSMKINSLESFIKTGNLVLIFLFLIDFWYTASFSNYHKLLLLLSAAISFGYLFRWKFVLKEYKNGAPISLNKDFTLQILKSITYFTGSLLMYSSFYFYTVMAPLLEEYFAIRLALSLLIARLGLAYILHLTLVSGINIVRQKTLAKDKQVHK